MKAISRVGVVGATPGGLLFARLMKKIRPASEVVVVERQSRADCAAAGMEFGGAAQALIGDYDPALFQAMRTYVAEDNSAVGQPGLLNLLIDSCIAVDVSFEFTADMTAARLADSCDLVLVDAGAQAMHGLEGAIGRPRHVIAIGARACPSHHASDRQCDPGVADATALFDAIWNDSRDISAALAAFRRMRALARFASASR